MKFVLVLLMWTPTSGVMEHVYEDQPFNSYMECTIDANKFVWRQLEKDGMTLNDLQGIRSLCLTPDQLDKWYKREPA